MCKFIYLFSLPGFPGRDTPTALANYCGPARAMQGPVSRKSRKPFGPEKPFLELRAADSVKLVFSYVVKGIKIKVTAKFRASRRLRFEDTKRIMSPGKCREFRETGTGNSLPYIKGVALEPQIIPDEDTRHE